MGIPEPCSEKIIHSCDVRELSECGLARADVSYQVIWITCHFVLFSSHEHDIINIVDQCDVLQNDQILQSLQIML